VGPPDGLDAKKKPLIARGFLLALLSGCAAFTLSEADCRNVNWHQRGYDDGYFGHPTQIVRLVQQCSRYGIAVPESQYLAGWEAGHDEWDRLMGSIGVD